MRIIHLSDIHVWRYTFNPLKLASKRAIGIMSLAAGRASRFRLERLRDVVDRVLGLGADHILITGDLTTTALPDEFRDAREALAELLVDPGRVTVVPGNHDRYTTGSVQFRAYEEWFGAFMPAQAFPWLRRIDADTAILGLDATRSHISATGRLPDAQLLSARRLVADVGDSVRRWIVACHYPVAAPPAYEHELSKKRMKNVDEVSAWLATIGPHLFCCGHVHAAWAFLPRTLPDQLCLNAGAPLLRDPTGLRPPGFLEITLHDRDVSAVHHAWVGDDWEMRPLYQNPAFFAPTRQGTAAAP